MNETGIVLEPIPLLITGGVIAVIVLIAIGVAEGITYLVKIIHKHRRQDGKGGDVR